MQTRTGVLLGTPQYMSPEQCRGSQELDGKSDVYSLGLLLYQMVAGAPPFISPEGDMGVLALHLLEPAPPLKTRAPATSPALAALIERMLAKNKDERPTMSDVTIELGRLLDLSPRPPVFYGDATTRRSAAGERTIWRRQSRRSFLSAAAGSALLTTGALLLYRRRSAPDASPPATTSPAGEVPIPEPSTNNAADAAPPPSDLAPAAPAPDLAAVTPPTPAPAAVATPAASSGSSGARPLRPAPARPTAPPRPVKPDNKGRPSRLVD